MIEIQIRETTKDRLTEEERRAIRARASRAYDASGCPDGAEVSVLLTGDEEIRTLNAQWRGLDEPTDVLSFALHEAEDDGMHGELLGDIVISDQTARRYVESGEHRRRLDDAVAAGAGWSIVDEIVFLVVHGLLHLLGHDHQEAADAKAMRDAEKRLYRATLGPSR